MIRRAIGPPWLPNPMNPSSASFYPCTSAEGWARPLSYSPAVHPRELLHPEVAEAIELIPFDHVDATILPSLRERFEMPASDTVERTEHRVPGDPEVPVRLHRAMASEGLRPCLYSIHGGGYVIGSYAMDDPLFDRLCPSLDLVGVSVEYRLAPETPYPGPMEDCYRGLTWTYNHAEELGVDPDRIGVAGQVQAGVSPPAWRCSPVTRVRCRSPSRSSTARCSMIGRSPLEPAGGCRCGAGSRTATAGGPTWVSASAAMTSRTPRPGPAG